MMPIINKTSVPYRWIATLYFAESLPYAVVTTLSTILYKNLGIPNLESVSAISFFFLPWILKPLFSPLIESSYTKRHWILLTETLILVVIALLAFSFMNQHFFMISIGLFLVLAFISSLHDISCDGFYLLSLKLLQQYRYVWLMNSAYQFSRLFCQGGLVLLAGWLALHTNKHLAWHIVFIILAVLMLGITFLHSRILPRTESTTEQSLSLKNIMTTTKGILQEWLGLPQITLVAIFIIFYNAADAQLMRIVPLFFMDDIASHGLSMSTFAVGTSQLVGIGAIIIGAVALSFCLQKISLKNTLLQATILLLIANSGYFVLTLLHQPNLILIFIIYGVAQFMFGFCNGTYMAFLMRQAKNKTYRTAYYALLTAMMSLSFLLFGLLSGYLQHFLDYHLFFLWIILVSMIVAGFTYYFTQHYAMTI